MHPRLNLNASFRLQKPICPFILQLQGLNLQGLNLYLIYVRHFFMYALYKTEIIYNYL